MKFQVFVNEKKNTVAVKAINPINEYYIEYCNFYKKHGLRADSTLFDEFINIYGRQINKMVGIATCNTAAGDIFNEEIGRKIAHERFMKVFESYRINMYHMITAKMDNIAWSAATRMNNCAGRRDERDTKISQIIHNIKE